MYIIEIEYITKKSVHRNKISISWTLSRFNLLGRFQSILHHLTLIKGPDRLGTENEEEDQEGRYLYL